MFDTSKDILNITIAVCIVSFTFFSCWGIYYIVKIIKNISEVVDDFKNLFTKMDYILDLIKDKIQSSTSYLFLIGEAAKKIISFCKKGEGKHCKGFKFPGFGKKKKGEDKNTEEDSDETKEEDDDQYEDDFMDEYEVKDEKEYEEKKDPTRIKVKKKK